MYVTVSFFILMNALISGSNACKYRCLVFLIFDKPYLYLTTLLLLFDYQWKL